MNIDESSIILAKALQGAKVGDNSQLSIIEQMKENPIQYCQSLLHIIKSAESLITTALIELKNIINLKFKTFPPDFIQFLCNEYIALFININDPNQLRIMVPVFIKLYDFFGQNWTDFPSVFNVQPEKMTFQIELLSELLLDLKKNIEFIQNNMGIFLNLTLAGLQQDDWDLRLKCIRVIVQISALDPEAVAPHINIILSFIQNSSKMPEQLFFALWLEFNSLTSFFEFQQDQLQIIFQSVIQSLESEHLTADAKLEALSTLTFLPFLNEQSAMNILNQIFNLAIIKLQAGEFLDSASDVFEKVIEDYGVQSPYRFLKEKIASSMSSNTAVAETVSVSLYILQSLIDRVEAQIRNDWQFFNQIIDNVSKSKPEENPLLIESCLRFISSLNSNFEMQILGSHLFADFTIPLIVSPSPEIRHHARNAVYKSMDNVSVPVAGIADKIWSINSKVADDEYEYLLILAKAIEQESDQFETEKALQMSQFLITCLNSDNEKMVIGALSVAIILVMSNEAVHGILLQPTIETIQKCLSSESTKVQINGLNAMSSLFPNFKNLFQQESIQKVEQLIHGQDTKLVEQAATCFFVIAKELGQKMVIDNIIPIFQQWIISQNEDYFTVAVTAVQSLAPVLDPAKISEVVGNICEVAMKTSDEEIASDCFDAIAAILSKTDILARPKIYQTALSLSLAFLRGEFAISHECAPLDCDFVLSTIMSYAGLLCELLHFKHEMNSFIFEFAQSLIATQNIDYIDIALSVLSDGILFDGFYQPQQKAFIISYIMKLFDPETNIVLIHGIANAFLCLIEKDNITIEACNKCNPAIIQWWKNIYSTMKDITLPTLTNLSMLIWLIALKYGILIPDVFAQSFELFPPKDKNDTLKMCEMLMQIVNNQQLKETFAIPIALAISKLLILPKMMLIKKEISDDMIMNLGSILNGLFSSDQKVQEAITHQYENSQVSQSRIMNFIH
ncbi:hypothetical protein M9Y10_045040 [Tritrichomonas musculus]|uniref:Importin N-terminal domain-containing protein n=1 Tax=Tritrichomonas musculus TaxID=1915356 RepID=A0ABR2JUC7_9EUKA